MAWIENLNTIEDFQITLSRTLPSSTYFRGPVFAYPSTGEQLACWSDGKIRRVNDNSTLHTFSDLTYIDLGGFFVSEGIVYVSGRNTGTNYGYFKKLVLSTLTESTLYSRASTGEETACSLTYPGWGVFGFAGAAFLTIRKIDLSDDSITELTNLAIGTSNVQIGGTTTTCYYAYRDTGAGTYYYKSIPMAGGSPTSITTNCVVVGVLGWHTKSYAIWDGPHVNSWTPTANYIVGGILFLNNTSPYHALVVDKLSGGSTRRLRHIRLNADTSVTLVKEYYSGTQVGYTYFLNSGINFPPYRGTTKPSLLYKPYLSGFYQWSLPYKDII